MYASYTKARKIFKSLFLINLFQIKFNTALLVTDKQQLL